MNTSQALANMDRKEYPISQIGCFGRGLEIGASYNPLVPKSIGTQIEILDYASGDQLREEYRGVPGIDRVDIRELTRGAQIRFNDEGDDFGQHGNAC